MKIIDTIFCEDIRFELNNKLSLIGLYSDQIIFRFNKDFAAEINWPIMTRLSLLLRFKIDNDEKHPDRFKFNFLLKNKSIVSLGGNINIDKNQSTINLAVSVPNLSVEPGNLGFLIELYENNNIVFTLEETNAINITTE